jgi:hypothetical protein
MEYMKHDRLQELAVITEQPRLPARDQIPSLQWAVDEKTGRPVSRWVSVAANPTGRR